MSWFTKAVSKAEWSCAKTLRGCWVDGCGLPHVCCGGGGLDASEDVSIAVLQHRVGELGNSLCFPRLVLPFEFFLHMTLSPGNTTFLGSSSFTDFHIAVPLPVIFRA